MAEPKLTAPGQPPDPPSTPEPPPVLPPVVVKKYANRRLYNTETSSYITLDNLAGMIRAGRDFVVYDAKSSEDITRTVLTQIIVEEESKGSAMLPTAFLRQLIGFYGGNLEGVVPRYLEYTMSSFARQQQQVRTMMERTFSPFLPTGVEEMNRQNIALFERAFSMWNPFMRDDQAAQTGTEATQASSNEGDQGHSAGQAAGDDTAPEQMPPTRIGEGSGAPAASEPAPATPPADSPSAAELGRLQSEIESLQRQLAAAHAAAFAPRAEPANIPENVKRDPERGATPVKPAVGKHEVVKPGRKPVRGTTARN